jgi:hypothetical protein
MLGIRTLFKAAILVAIATQVEAANCVIPIGPTVTHTEGADEIGVTRQNTYAEGSKLCIYDFDQENSCDLCVRGRIHVCTAGFWHPMGQECAEKNAVKPDNGKGGNQQSPKQNSAGQQPSGGAGGQQYDQPSGDNGTLCGILQTC